MRSRWREIYLSSDRLGQLDAFRWSKQLGHIFFIFFYRVTGKLVDLFVIFKLFLGGGRFGRTRQQRVEAVF